MKTEDLIQEVKRLAGVAESLAKACAMKDEALKKAIPFIGYGAHVPHIVEMAEQALSASQPQVSELERNRLEPLRDEIAELKMELDCAKNKVCSEIVALCDAGMDFIEKTNQNIPMVEIQAAEDKLRAVISNTQATAEQFKADCEQRGAVKARSEDESLLTWMQNNPAFTVELSDEGEGEEIWIVHKVSGGRNDREWSEAGRGYSIREALRDAKNRATSKKAG